MHARRRGSHGYSLTVPSSHVTRSTRVAGTISQSVARWKTSLTRSMIRTWRRSTASERSKCAPDAFSRSRLPRGAQPVCVTNFPPWRIAIFDSEVLTLEAIEADGRVILLRPDDAAELGSLVG